MMIRRIYSWAFMVAVVVLAAACTAEHDSAEVPQAGSAHFKATVTHAPVETETRSLAVSETNADSILTTWKGGEQVALIYTPPSGSPTKVVVTVTAVNEDGSAVIEGTLAEVPAAGTAVTVIYPASAADGATGNVRADVLAEQDGTLETISAKCDVATATSTLAPPASDGSVSFSAPLTLTHQNAICHLKMLDIERNELTATKVVISDVTGGADNVITTVTLDGGATEFYVALPATTTTNDHHNFVATVGEFDDNYAISGYGELKGGCYYQDEMLMKIVVNVTEETFTVNGVSFTMVNVKQGKFTIGASTNRYSPRFDAVAYDAIYTAASSVHIAMKLRQVTLSAYSIGKYEVTNELWNAVMDKRPTAPVARGSRVTVMTNAKNPVSPVSKSDADAFVAKLNELLEGQLGGRKFHLPTQAQWEVAARGGGYNSRYIYAGGNQIDYVATYYNNAKTSSGKKVPSEIGQRWPNELGIYDMTGNTSEWTCDYYDEQNYADLDELYIDAKLSYDSETGTHDKAHLAPGYLNQMINISSLAYFQDNQTDPHSTTGSPIYCGGNVLTTTSYYIRLWGYECPRSDDETVAPNNAYVGIRLALSNVFNE